MKKILAVIVVLLMALIAGCDDADTTPPVITFSIPLGYQGEVNNVFVPCGVVFDAFLGVRAKDPGNEDPVRLEIESQLFGGENGSNHILTVDYVATDQAGNETRASRTIKFDDNEAPAIVFDPDYASQIGGRWVTIVMSPQEAAQFSGFKVVDACDGDITRRAITAVAAGDNPMVWEITIAAVDQAGNEAAEILTALNFGPAEPANNNEAELTGEGEGEGEGEPTAETENKETALADFYLASGASLPWIYYGQDFGAKNGDFASKASRQQLGDNFLFLAQNGASVVRVFLGCDLSSGLKDYDGIVGWDPAVFENVSVLLAEAQAAGLRVILVFLDYTVADGIVITDDGVIVGERPELLTNQKTLLLGLLGQLLSAYQGNPAIYGIEIINHPENAIALSASEMKSFVQDAAGIVHNYGLTATVCSRGRADVGQWQGLNLDFYEFSYDDSMEAELPLDYPAGQLGLDKPVLVDIQASAVWLKLNLLRKNGYAGALCWSLNSDPAEGDFANSADRYLAYFLNH